jgi:hypothetical protein
VGLLGVVLVVIVAFGFGFACGRILRGTTLKQEFQEGYAAGRDDAVRAQIDALQAGQKPATIRGRATVARVTDVLERPLARPGSDTLVETRTQ